MANTELKGFAKVLSMYSRAELGRGLGLTRATISYWGDTLPEAYKLRVSLLTGIPLSEFYPEKPEYKMKRKPDAKAKPKGQARA
jgi:hypothetical protein